MSRIVATFNVANGKVIVTPAQRQLVEAEIRRLTGQDRKFVSIHEKAERKPRSYVRPEKA